jgi:hypothetical protein
VAVKALNPKTQYVANEIKLSLCFIKYHATKEYGGVEVSLHVLLTSALERVWESGGISPCILNLGTRERCMISSMPLPLFLQGKSLDHALDMRMGGPQNQSGCDKEKVSPCVWNQRMTSRASKPESSHYVD